MQAARGASLNHSGQSNPDTQTRTNRRRIGLFATIAVVAYLLDLVSKIVAVNSLTGRPPVEIVGPYFTLDLAYNPGAAFTSPRLTPRS